ncbi:MAG: DUF1641 domain-containing protein [Saprospiraceae bacterium]|nr:DUF1641 domain-containing protein [Saprospiraceae bacterium]
MSSTIVKSRSEGPLQQAPYNGDTLSLLREILERMERIESTVEQLKTAGTQLPGLLAIGVDSADEMAAGLQRADIDMDERMRNAARLFDLMTDPATVRQLEDLLKFSHNLPGLLALAADSFDELATGSDLDKVVELAGAAGQALTRAGQDPADGVGLIGLIRAMRDPDRRRAMGFLMNYLKHFGKQLAK